MVTIIAWIPIFRGLAHSIFRFREQIIGPSPDPHHARCSPDLHARSKAKVSLVSDSPPPKNRYTAMSTFPGRPRKACSTCKSHKVSSATGASARCLDGTDVCQIRCTRERPVCTRCQRLNHTCIYSTPPNTRNARRLQPGSNTSKPSSTPTHTGAAATGDETSLLPHHITPVEDRYLGIPKTLLLTLVEVYYDNVYNARLLLHKRQFLESLAAGTARPHIVLSVCAWAAK